MDQMSGLWALMIMKQSRKLYTVLSILCFFVLLLVNLDFSIIYQNNIVIPFLLDETSILIRIEDQGTHLDDSNAFFDCIQNADKVIAFDKNIYDLLYYNEKDKLPTVWVRPSSPYELMKNGEKITLFGETYNTAECPFPISSMEADMIVPLYLKKSLAGRYFIQASDKMVIITAEKILGESDCAYSTTPLAKDIKGMIKELLFYKEGYVALLVFIFVILSFLTYTRLVAENNADELYIFRVFGANKKGLFVKCLRKRIIIYIVCLIVSIAASIISSYKYAGYLALTEFIIIDATCIYVSLSRCCKKMEVC